MAGTQDQNAVGAAAGWGPDRRDLQPRCLWACGRGRRAWRPGAVRAGRLPRLPRERVQTWNSLIDALSLQRFRLLSPVLRSALSNSPMVGLEDTAGPPHLSVDTAQAFWVPGEFLTGVSKEKHLFSLIQIIWAIALRCREAERTEEDWEMSGEQSLFSWVQESLVTCLFSPQGIQLRAVWTRHRLSQKDHQMGRWG